MAKFARFTKPFPENFLTPPSFLLLLLPSILPLAQDSCASQLGQEGQRDALLIPPDPLSCLITPFRIPWQSARPF